MPDPATDTSQDGSYGASFGAMATDASKATKAYADVTRQKVAAEGATENQMMRRGEEDRLRSVEAFKNEGIKPEELKPWNAEIEHKKFESDPLAGFASSGAVFAMIASAFTKAPMLSAIEGMSGALNGIKEGNEASYTRAFESYKQNVATAKAKHEIEHQAYTDALALGTHDLALSNAKLRAEAARFGDKQLLALADNGMVKEIYDTIAARNKSVQSAADLAEATTIRGMQQHALKTSFAMIDGQKGPPGPDGQPTEIPEAVKAAQKLRQINTVYMSGKMTQPAQMATAAIIMENPTASIDEITQKLEEKHLLPKALKPQEEAAKQGYEAEIAEHSEAGDLTPDKQNEIFKKWFPQGRGGAGGNSEAGRQGDVIRARATQLVEQAKQRGEELPFTVAEGQAKTEIKAKSDSAATHKKDLIAQEAKRLMAADSKLSEFEATAKATRAFDTNSRALSAHDVNTLRGKIDQADNAERKIAQINDFLDKYKGGAGLLGKIMRGEEIASNIVGAGTQSDRVQFRRNVTDLQKILPDIMADHNGKMLKSDVDKIAVLAAGLEAGDTPPNTKRAYKELLPDIKKRKKDFSARITTGFDPDKSSAGSEEGGVLPPPAEKKAPPNFDKLYPKVQ